MRTFGGDREERQGVDPVPAIHSLRPCNYPRGFECDLVSENFGGAEVGAKDVGVKEGERGCEERSWEDVGEGNVQVEDGGDSTVLEDVRSRVDEVEIGQVSVRSLCGRSQLKVGDAEDEGRTVEDAGMTEGVVSIVEIESSPNGSSRERKGIRLEI